METGIELIQKYFIDLTEQQLLQFETAFELYKDWNEKINVVSRKDIDSLFEKHILHSLAIAKFIEFNQGTRVLDIGTGGGFPGIPLSIFFPKVQFVLCDSIAKKITVAESISETIGLRNTDFAIGRVERLKESFDFIVSRAVAPADQLYRWTQSYISSKQLNAQYNGYLLLKGGDLKEELKTLQLQNKKLIIEEYPLTKWFEESFFETKKLVYIY
ncbi:MAG: 16S rRNA (guanine(527)-N(7))-methyltransferase RsmG [Bacteroidia bacterium]|jgi:16S rRNA (guanine527-N7)-methyltransferase|nr:16S rRNA (guanine(527)-N(7))-methyltransferase RsmG [Bacteroidia bacterium]